LADRAIGQLPVQENTQEEQQPKHKISLIHPNGTVVPASKRSVLEILAEAHQLPAYRTATEIDCDTQVERDP
jgi:hypothetical protein